MANLIISNACSLHCSYCFARDYLEASKVQPTPFLSIEAYKERLDFLARSEINEARLIGGEPTLHPQFAELLQYADERFPKIVVFSNGLISETALSALMSLPAEKVTVMVNASARNANGALTAPQQARRLAVMRCLGERAMIGYTIASVTDDLFPLEQLALDTGCRRSIRLGLAQPALVGRNAFLHPRSYPAVGEQIVAFAVQSARSKVRVELDCGFVRCMFSQQGIEALNEADAYVAWNCNAVLDIDLDGQVGHCFPLAGRFLLPLRNEDRAQDLRERFAPMVRPYRTAGIYPECSSCTLRRTESCTGGCLALTLRRFQPASFSVDLPASHSVRLHGQRSAK